MINKEIKTLEKTVTKFIPELRENFIKMRQVLIIALCLVPLAYFMDLNEDKIEGAIKGIFWGLILLSVCEAAFVKHCSWLLKKRIARLRNEVKAIYPPIFAEDKESAGSVPSYHTSGKDRGYTESIKGWIIFEKIDEEVAWSIVNNVIVNSWLEISDVYSIMYLYSVKDFMMRFEDIIKISQTFKTIDEVIEQMKLTE